MAVVPEAIPNHSVPSGPPVKSPWLDAFVDPVAGMVCYSQFMCMCDLHADGNNRLILVDLEKSIRIYKGHTIQWEQKLMDVSSTDVVQSGAPTPTATTHDMIHGTGGAIRAAQEHS